MDRVDEFYVFLEEDPKTGEMKTVYAIGHTLDGQRVFEISADREYAREQLKLFCRQNGYLKAEEVLADSRYGRKSKKEIIDYLSAGNENATVKRKNFNFFTGLKPNQEKLPSPIRTKKEEKEKGKIQKIWENVRKKVGKVVAMGTIVVTICSSLMGSGFPKKVNQDNKYAGKTVTFATTTYAGNTTKNDTTTPIQDNTVDNFNENTATFDELIAHTTNQSKKSYMTKFRETIRFFNGEFANRHKDANKETKLCLATDELEAWYLANNGKDLSNDQIVTLFDKTKLDKEEAIEKYESATSQMILAAIVQKEPTNLDNLIENTQGKEFYKKYETMNINSNVETDAAKQKQIYKDFFAMARDDFKVNDENGFDHPSLSQMEIQNYYSSVLPFISAMNEKIQRYGAEIGFTQEELAQFEDSTNRIHDEIMCDLPYQNIRDVADRLQMYQIANPDKTYTDPTHDNFMRAIKDELVKEGNYNLENRDISILVVFANSMHDKTEELIAGKDEGSVSTKTEHKVVAQHTETTTSERTETTKTDLSREEAIATAGEDDVKEAEAAEAAGISQKNQEEKAKAEKAADEEAKKQQAVEDKKGAYIDNQIEDTNKGIDKTIDTANKVIDAGEKVTIENPDIEINSSYVNEDGTLNGGISDITKNPTGGVAPSEELPDPNETGKKFDNSATGDSAVSNVIIEEDVDVPDYNADAVNQAMSQMEAGQNVMVTSQGIIEIVPTEQETVGQKVR